ncbi:hypothetical protein M408DRAFT_329609 [Serendipita vermifera MAFF 305830]|uniref:Uncharacterized protein n=1 Tax=Serendipita vermifera MAFF 305830 TaxID=933852 RepID=A0A0C3B9Y3_SERVB|nr:hypothetical protein M408DRAFT_329609 [Serendipita vermifera MAFF 305830]
MERSLKGGVTAAPLTCTLEPQGTAFIPSLSLSQINDEYGRYLIKDHQLSRAVGPASIIRLGTTSPCRFRQQSTKT